jgi:deoxyribose-phosphate aldolase
MALRSDELAKTIDHSLLRATVTTADVEHLCAEARDHHFATVCVPPYAVPVAAASLRGCDVKVSTVVSYPLGTDSSRAKVVAAEHAVAAGADELGVVVNVGALLSGDFRYVRDELAALSRAVRVKSVNGGRGLVLMKVILQCEHLDDKLTKLACKLAEDGGADFVETSTGRSDALATLYDVEILRDALPESIGVKASGGITSAEDAEAVIAAGAGRIGTTDAVQIMRGFSRSRQVS